MSEEADQHGNCGTRVSTSGDLGSNDYDDDDVYYYMRWRLKLEGETGNMGVCTKERKGVTAAVLMATPCTNSLGGESGGQKHEGCGGRCLLEVPRRLQGVVARGLHYY